MHSCELNENVKIKATGVVGKITAIWLSITGKTQYQITYYDTTNRRADSWMLEDEFEPVSTEE